MGKKRRVENADPDLDGEDEDGLPDDAHKRRKREAELQQQVEEYTVRACLLIDRHRFILFR